jgi:outer membrane protein OmpA-like peptidoglycan-associated protein
MIVRMIRTSLVLLCALTSIASADGGLGQKDPGLYNLKGTIYFLPDGTDRMPPDIEKQNAQGTIYTEALDVPEREFEQGFPGVTSRFEWFGIVYTGTFDVKTAGDYAFRSISDDGIRVWIDGKEILELDSIHPPSEATGTVKLAPGLHAIKVWYFQGPANQIALQLFVKPPGGEEKIFSMKDYAGALGDALKQLGGEATPEGIRVRLDAKVLFDLDKAVLKKDAQQALGKLATVLKAYPTAAVHINGYTSSEGNEAHNQKLSQDRANAVKAALGKLVAKTVALTAQGLGASSPIADNKTEATRAPNRRVEVVVHP